MKLSAIIKDLESKTPNDKERALLTAEGLFSKRSEVRYVNWVKQEQVSQAANSPAWSDLPAKSAVN